jgi:hypothetical protein
MEPLMFKYKGSPMKQFNRIPGKHPISRSFNGMMSISKSLMALSPFKSEYIVVRKSYLD